MKLEIEMSNHRAHRAAVIAQNAKKTYKYVQIQSPREEALQESLCTGVESREIQIYCSAGK